MCKKRPRLRVLYVTNKELNAPQCGGSVREYNLLKHLVNHHEIHLIAFVGSLPYDVEDESKCLPFSGVTKVKVQPSSFSNNESPDRMKEHAHPSGKSIVEDLIDKISPNIIHVEGYFLMQHMPPRLSVPILLVGENIESDLSSAAALIQGVAKLKSATISKERDEEVRCWRQATHVVMVTDADAARVRSIAVDVSVNCVGNGVDVPALSPAVLDSEVGKCAPSALFVGNYGWFPTADAAMHLVRDIWPRVLMLLPNARLVLAGRNVSDELAEAITASPGITLFGAFDSYADLLPEADIFVCPLRFAGGFKVKVAEAMSYGLPVVCSCVSVEGFPKVIHEEVLMADDPSIFALATAALLEATTTRARMSQRSFNAVSQLPSWRTQALKLEEIWASCASK